MRIKDKVKQARGRVRKEYFMRAPMRLIHSIDRIEPTLKKNTARGRQELENIIRRRR